RHRTEWVAAILGLMLFEREDPAAAGLLASDGSTNCESAEPRSLFRHRVCVARALLAADSGACRQPPAVPPNTAELSATERDWWLAWWLLGKRCTDATDHSDAAMDALAGDRPLPRWLAVRLPDRDGGRTAEGDTAH